MWRVRGLALAVAVAVALGLISESRDRVDGAAGLSVGVSAGTASSAAGPTVGRRWE
jgi:hypothetical protein